MRGDFFLEIIRHQNFNPRIIEWVSGYVRVREGGARGYRGYIGKILKSPEEIWSYAFEQQISNAAQNLLFALYERHFGEDVADLERSWQALHRHTSTKYNFPTSSHDFRQALNELEGSFIEIDRGHVDYLNPSIRDFIENVLSNNRDRAVDLVISTTTFRLIIAIRELWEERETEELRQALTLTPELLAKLRHISRNPHIRWRTDDDGRQTGIIVDTSLERRISMLISWAEEVKSESLIGVASEILDELEAEWKSQVVDFIPLIGLLKIIESGPWVLSHDALTIRRRILDGVLSALKFARHQAWKSLLEYRRASSALSTDDEHSSTLA